MWRDLVRESLATAESSLLTLQSEKSALEAAVRTNREEVSHIAGQRDAAQEKCNGLEEQVRTCVLRLGAR